MSIDGDGRLGYVVGCSAGLQQLAGFSNRGINVMESINE